MKLKKKTTFSNVTCISAAWGWYAALVDGEDFIYIPVAFWASGVFIEEKKKGDAVMTPALTGAIPVGGKLISAELISTFSHYEMQEQPELEIEADSEFLLN